MEPTDADVAAYARVILENLRSMPEVNAEPVGGSLTMVAVVGFFDLEKLARTVLVLEASRS